MVIVTDQLVKERADALARCSFLPGSWDKRFARDMAARTEFSPRQAANIARLAWKYRRQMPAALVPASDPSVALGLAAQEMR